ARPDGRDRRPRGLPGQRRQGRGGPRGVREGAQEGSDAQEGALQQGHRPHGDRPAPGGGGGLGRAAEGLPRRSAAPGPAPADRAHPGPGRRVVIGALVFVIRLLFWLLVVRLVLRTFGAFLGGLREPSRTPPPRRPGATALVRDRVCNTFLPPDRAITAPVAGRTEYYCSAACRDQALRIAPRAS